MTSLRNKDIKLTYFDARIKGEPIRLLLAFGGYEYELWRKYFIKVKCMWSYKVHRWAGSASLGRPGRLAGSEALLLLGPPSLPHSRRGENLRVNGHLQEPNILYHINLKANVFYNKTKTYYWKYLFFPRYLAREMGLSGKTSLENALMDEIVDVVQDILDKNVSYELLLSIFLFWSLYILFSIKHGTHPTRKRHLRTWRKRHFPPPWLSWRRSWRKEEGSSFPATASPLPTSTCSTSYRRPNSCAPSWWSSTPTSRAWWTELGATPTSRTTSRHVLSKQRKIKSS